MCMKKNQQPKNTPAISVMLTSGLFSRNGEQFVRIFYFYRRQSSTINNSAVIKQFVGQWASGTFSHQTSVALTPTFQALSIISHRWQDRHFLWTSQWFAGCCSSSLLMLQIYQMHWETFVRPTLPSITQAVFQVPETVCEGCIAAAVPFRQRMAWIANEWSGF